MPHAVAWGTCWALLRSALTGSACRANAGRWPVISPQCGHRRTAGGNTQSPALYGPMIHLTTVNAKYPRYACGYFLACINMVKNHANAWTYSTLNACLLPTASAIRADCVGVCYERPTAAKRARRSRRRFYETSRGIAYARGRDCQG